MMSTEKIGKTLPQKFNFHDDTGHGWLQVPFYALEILDITRQITGHSYRSGEMVYLEEKQDAVTFIKAWLVSQEQAETDFAYFRKRCRDVYSHHSFIRSLPSYEL